MSNDTEEGNIPSEEMEEKKENVLFTLRNILIGAAGLICIGLVFYFAIIKIKAKADEIANLNEFMKFEAFKTEFGDQIGDCLLYTKITSQGHELMKINLKNLIVESISEKIKLNDPSYKMQKQPLRPSVLYEENIISFAYYENDNIDVATSVKLYTNEGKFSKQIELKGTHANQFSYCFRNDGGILYYAPNDMQLIYRIFVHNEEHESLGIGSNIERSSNLMLDESGSLFFVASKINSLESQIYKRDAVPFSSYKALFKVDCALENIKTSLKNNFILVSTKDNYLLILDLLQEPVACRKVSLKGYEQINNAIMSKDEQFMYLVAGNKNSQTSSLIAVKCNLNTIEDGSVLEGKRVPIEELDVADIAVM